MSTDIAPVQIPEKLRRVIGEVDDGTRLYRAAGTDKEYTTWFEALISVFHRGLVSPGGGCPIAGVSRAAIHKAMFEGRLTAFAFQIEKKQRGLFGWKSVRQSPYLYLPVQELKQWRALIEERLRVTDREQLRRELEGAKPDFFGNFDKPRKRRR